MFCNVNYSRYIYTYIPPANYNISMFLSQNYIINGELIGDQE